MIGDTVRGSVAATRSKGSAVFSPLYQQIKHLLVESLRRGQWKPGAMIPSEMELASRFQVSQGTVRKAIDELAAENLLVRRQGKGTFVATHHEPRAQYRFLRLLPDDGEDGPARSEFLECRRARAGAEFAAQLGLKVGDPVVHVRRLLSFDDAPLVLDDIWLPGRQFRGLNFERLSSYRGPLYGLFESEFGVRMIRAEERLRAVAADADAAGLLHVEAGSPLLLVERVSFTYGERPVEVRRGLYVTRGHHYHNTLS
jgi:GntR family transcriptional regulator